MPSFNFDNQFAKLGDLFSTSMPPEGFTDTPSLMHFNSDLATELNLDDFDPQDQSDVAILAGGRVPQGAEPLAMVYSGHQFGNWAGQLGDGRALLLGQHRAADKTLWDIQLKGAGKTPYSRFGDGRAVVRSSIREYLCSEAMHGLGIPTTRALGLVATNRGVMRERAEPGAILTRVATSHIRFGHFEHFSYGGDHDALKTLMDYVLKTHFPSISPSSESAIQDWFAEVCRRTGDLMARWQAVGFCHGVMNTDNMSITGLTIDYGPFGFLEDFNPHHICNRTDQGGRYAYDQQPHIAIWNLHALANALKPILEWDEATSIISAAYGEAFNTRYASLYRAKLGLNDDLHDTSTDELWQNMLKLGAKAGVDYPQMFRKLDPSKSDNEAWIALFPARFETEAKAWQMTYNAYFETSGLDPIAAKAQMDQVNPAYVLRNWIAEKAIRAAEDQKDYSVLADIFALMKNPFKEVIGFEEFLNQGDEASRGIALSCSS